MKPEKAFVYILYGDSLAHFQEAVFSIATLRQHNTELPIIVLADCPDRFPSLPNIQVVPIDKQMAEEWMSDSTYHFRLKLQGIRYLLGNCAEKLIYLDTDTLVRKDLGNWFDQINNENALMHKFEGRLGNSQFREHYQNVLGRSFTHTEFNKYDIDVHTPMYNSGLIGLCRQHLSSLDEALWLMEETDALIEWHTAEQLALGLALLAQGEVNTVGDRQVYHYWHKGPRRYIRSQLQSLLHHHSPQALLTSPALIEQINVRRSFPVWLRDKISRLRGGV